MPGFKIADGFLEITTDSGQADEQVVQFVRRTDRRLKAASRDAERHGRQAGDRFGRGLMSGFARRMLGFGRLFAVATLGAVKLTALAGAAMAVSAALAGLASAISGVLPLIAGLASTAAAAAGSLLLIPAGIATLVASLLTVKLGMKGVSDAFKAAAEGDAEKLNEALKKLAPTARAFVKEIIKLKPAFDKLRLAVQQRLFAGLAQQVRLLGLSYIPILTRELGGLATVLGQGMVAVLQQLNTAASRTDVARTLNNITGIARNFTAALRPAVRILTDILVVSTAVGREITSGVGAAVGRFADKIAALRASGGLAKIITDGLQALAAFGNLAKDIFGILKGIFGAAGASDGIFQFFHRLNETINSIAGQQTLRNLFSQLSIIGAALMPVLLALAQALVPIAKGLAAIATNQSVISALVGLAQALGAALGSLAPGLVALAPAVAALARGLKPLADILVGLVTGLAPGLTQLITFLVIGLQELAPAAEPVGRAIGAVLKALSPLLPLIGKLASTVLQFMAPALEALAAILGPIVEVLAIGLFEALEAVTPALSELARTILPLVVDFARRLGPLLAPVAEAMAQVGVAIARGLLDQMPRISQLFERLLPIGLQLWEMLGQAITEALLAVAPLLPPLIVAIVDVADAWVQLVEAIRPVLPLIRWLLVNLAVGGLVGTVLVLIAALRLLRDAYLFAAVGISFAIDKVKAIAGWFRDAPKSIESFGSAVRTQVGNVITFFLKVPGMIRGALGNLGSLLYDAGRQIIQGLINGLVSKANDLKDTLVGFGDKIKNWKGPLDKDRRMLVPEGRAIMEGLRRGLEAGLPAVKLALAATTAAIPAAMAPPQPAPIHVQAGPATVVVMADFGDGLRQVVNAQIVHNPAMVAQAVDEGRRQRSFMQTGRAKT